MLNSYVATTVIALAVCMVEVIMNSRKSRLFRPTINHLEARDLPSTTLIGIVIPPGGGYPSGPKIDGSGAPGIGRPPVDPKNPPPATPK